MAAGCNASRYMHNPEIVCADVRGSNGDKIKTIVMNSKIVECAEKDLKIGSNSFSPRLAKLELNKKESEMLRRYLVKFKDGNGTRSE